MIVRSPRASAPVASPVPPACPVPLADPGALAALGTAEHPRPHWPGRRIEIDSATGSCLHVRETPGPDDTEETAVFVHGLGGSSTNWTELAGALSARWHGLAPDLPGFGRSDPPAGRDYGLAAHAAAITALVERTAVRSGPVHLLGNSLGGAVALLVAAARPDLVRTLTLVSPAMPDLRPAPSRLGDARMILSAIPFLGSRARDELAAEDSRLRLARTMRLCWADPHEVSPAAFELAAGEAAERAGLPWAAEALHRSFVGLVRTWFTRGPGSLWAAAGRVPVPALVVWGEADRLVTVRKARRTAAALPAGRALRLPAVGHVAQMERPGLVGRAVLGLADAAAADIWTVPRQTARDLERTAARPIGARPRASAVGVRTVADAAPEPHAGYGTVPA